MSNKVKGELSIFFMSLIFYMMVTTKYTHALGDYLLEFIGLKSWTGNYSGLHLTVIYFGVLFIFSIFLVEKYAINQLNIRGKSVFIIFLVLVTVFYSLTGIIAINIKENSPGLLSIGCNLSDSNIAYRAENNKYVEFKAEFELTNYSEEEKVFYISMYRYSYGESDNEEINFYTLNGEKAIFKLNGNESRKFTLSLDNYNIFGGINNGINSGGGNGLIAVMELTNDEGDKVILNKNNSFFGELSSK